MRKSFFYWVNLQKAKNGWYWPSGEKVQHWGPWQPSGTAAGDACAAIYGASTLLMELCCSNDSNHYICEAPKIGCIPGHFGKTCSYGFHIYTWVSGVIVCIFMITIIALLFYIRLQHIKYKKEIEYKMCNKPRGYCIIVYTIEEDIYISHVELTPKDPQNLQLHVGQIIEVASSTGHEDILYGRQYGVDNANEGFLAKKHVKQSQYGLADADLCADLWNDLGFTVHKMEVKTVEDFKTKLLNLREVISADTGTQDCFSFTFIVPWLHRGKR
ncbi:unnamed protein product [Meganyctiphanes norvegica]|uniref:C-type lectin domain-containing protein n=1 Tax=Meganyctiphanes norvegica TaxID=48144 RepID=A0AAV2SA19_MEGNR